jgi:crotonobetainyl-CoA:carnitine CoA-transferase CaiB-like acyl-CoA transferase
MAHELLTGVRVVELAMYAFAPSAAAVLADWGAEVIKVVVRILPGMATPWCIVQSRVRSIPAGASHRLPGSRRSARRRRRAAH